MRKIDYNEYLFLALLTSEHKELDDVDYERQRIKMGYDISGGANVNHILFHPFKEDTVIKYMALMNNSRKQHYDKIYAKIKLDEEISVKKGGRVSFSPGNVELHNNFLGKDT